MAFWGTEVRPGKPYTHIHDSTSGRLRISQATLGNGKSTGKSVVQCNVGNRSPVLLCSLLPNVSETSHLELEFEEDDEVVFSVLGQRSVHLSGYFLGSKYNGGGDDTDSYGEDIAETDSDDGSEDEMYDDEDEYESDFVVDDDIELFPHSPQRKSSVVIEEISEDEKPANGNAKRRFLKKRRQVSDSDDGSAESQGQLVVSGNRSVVLESDDEDGFPVSVYLNEKNAVKNNEENAMSNDKNDDDKKRKIDAISQEDPGSARESCQLSDMPAQPEVGTEDGGKSKKKKGKERKPLESGPMSSVEESTSVDKNQVPGNEDVCIPSGDSAQPGKPNIDAKEKDLVVNLDGAENVGVQKKKKERVKKGKISGTGIDLFSEKTDSKSKTDPDEDSKNDNLDQDLPSSIEPEKLAIEKDVDHSIVEISGKLKKRNKKKKAKDENARDKDGEVTPVKVDINDEQQKTEDAEKMDEDLMVTQLPNYTHPEVSVNPVADAVDEGSAKDKKKKKKKKKKSEKDLNTNQESADRPATVGKADLVKGMEDDAQPLQTREFHNGLIIEELSMGKPDGKRASPGSHVFVHYVGKLKNGNVFDSSTGGKPFSFRLGIGQVIKGWDVGVAGMRIGDKRRLTVPPSMGYGEERVGKIPGNSWLVFDVELVNVKGGR